MKTEKYLIILLLITLNSCGGPLGSWSIGRTSDAKGKNDCKEAKQFSKWVRNNDKIYWGEGITPIKNGDLGSAVKAAEKDAIGSLSEAISVRVETDFVIIVIGKDTTITEEVKDIIKTMTDAIISDRKRSEPFWDCPRPGYVTYYTWVTKKNYDEKVKRNLEEKKSNAISIIKSADEEFDNGNYITAVQSWLGAKEYLNSVFTNIPVRGFVAKNEEVYLNGYLTNKITNFFGKVNIDLLNKDFVFGAQGQLNKDPLVWVYYDSDQIKHPIANLPLRVSFDKGAGKVSDIVVTEFPRGDARIEVDQVDASVRSARLMVEIDKASFVGLDNLRHGRLPFRFIDMTKKRTMGVLITFDNIIPSSDVETSRTKIMSILRDLGFGSFEISQVGRSREVDQEMKEKAAAAHADYLIHSDIKVVQPPERIPRLNNLYMTALRATFSMHEVPAGDEYYVSVPELDKIEGYGASAEIAIKDANESLRRATENAVKILTANLR